MTFEAEASDGIFVFDCNTPGAAFVFEGHGDPSATAEVMMDVFTWAMSVATIDDRLAWPNLRGVRG